MALSKQMSRGSTLLGYVRELQAAGFRVGEMRGISVVHPVHAPDSWHYDEQDGFGLAVDVNWPDPVTEMPHLIWARKRAEELGLAVTLAEKGPVAGHADHLHVDCGLLSNLGDGVYHAAGDGLTTGGSGGSTSTPTTTITPEDDDMVTSADMDTIAERTAARLLATIVEGDGITASVSQILTGTRVDPHDQQIAQTVLNTVVSGDGIRAPVFALLTGTRIAAGIAAAKSATSGAVDVDELVAAIKALPGETISLLVQRLAS